MKKRKTETVCIKIQDINEQEDSPVMNLLVYFPEIVINKYKYLEYERKYHIYLKNEKYLVLVIDNNVVIEESEIDISFISDLYSKHLDLDTYLPKQKELISTLIKALLIDFIFNEIFRQGFKSVNIESQTGGTYLEDCNWFASLISKHINLNLGIIEEHPIYK